MLVLLFWLFALFICLLIDLIGAWFTAWVITLVIGFAGIVLTTSQFWLLVGGLFLIGFVRFFK